MTLDEIKQYKLETEIERLRDGVGSLTLMIAARDTEIERLQKEWAILQKDWTICWEGCGELRADNERLRALLQKLKWKSIEKDNMEFRCDITCYVMDEIRAALEPKP